MLEPAVTMPKSDPDNLAAKQRENERLVNDKLAPVARRMCAEFKIKHMGGHERATLDNAAEYAFRVWHKAAVGNPRIGGLQLGIVGWDGNEPLQEPYTSALENYFMREMDRK